jgi:hypothetical protein
MGGNRIDVLLNGDETFPAMLREIKTAKRTITFSQYLYEDGALARQFAGAFAERCGGSFFLRGKQLGNLPRVIESFKIEQGVFKLVDSGAGQDARSEQVKFL